MRPRRKGEKPPKWRQMAASSAFYPIDSGYQVGRINRPKLFAKFGVEVARDDEFADLGKGKDLTLFHRGRDPIAENVWLGSEVVSGRRDGRWR
jgi:hypothetical protein